jgi:hypothetical protein
MSVLQLLNLKKIGIRVHCLALGGVDLTSSAGKMTMGVINSVAQFERDLLIESDNFEEIDNGIQLCGVLNEYAG